MDIKKIAMDMWAKAKVYAVEHKYEIGTAVSDVVFGLGMASLGYIAGVAITDRTLIYNSQINELVKNCTAAKADGTWTEDDILRISNEIKK